MTVTKPNILIVDDDLAVRGLLCAILSEKYECVSVGSAEEALSRLQNESFDLVISDINMGEMSGIELVSKIVELSPDTVVMVISGNQSMDSPIGAIRCGAFDYLQKPFDIDQVLMSVDRSIAHAALLVLKRRHDNHLEALVAERTERLNYLAYYDALTGLPNRSFFEDKVSKCLSNDADQNIAIYFVSLDRFKNVRNTLGHALGSRLIKEVAKRLATLAGKGAFAARFDGDEFALLLTGHCDKKLAELAEYVSYLFKEPFNVGDYEIFISISLGICRSGVDGRDSPTLLRNAGAALAEARLLGGNNYQFYTCDIHARAVARLAMETDLRRALERGEFELFYQPKIDIRSKRVVGMEALIRWNHPKLGLVSPADFIPVAEETGLIVPIGEWVVKTACSQNKRWHDSGFPLNVAVNLSTCQFQQRDLADTIKDIVRDSGLDPQFLNLEVTESSIMNNAETAVAILRELKDTGIKISIDDFGTGYSSLGVLKNLPIDVLKIDKSFVNDVTHNPDDAAFVTTIVTLAHNLRLKVVAEGVETEEQFNFLRLLRCDEWQGYLFSKPIPAAAFEKLLA
ncbi:MAG: EAL domain-containing protein [Pyrinomonadaceae bacterium]